MYSAQSNPDLTAYPRLPRKALRLYPLLVLWFFCVAIQMAQAQQATPVRESLTLWDNWAHLRRAIPDADVQTWKRVLHTHPSVETAARLHLHLGEWELAAHEDPFAAMWHFRAVQQIAPHTDRAYGRAAFDLAIALYYHGAYTRALAAFNQLVAPNTRLTGYDRRTSALWQSHARACVGYHAAHAALGITEPTYLNPLCGIEALAACLQAQGLSADRRTMLAHCRVSGLGNSLTDLQEAARRFGREAWPIKADAQALQLLPKPMVAYVEHDHFIALIRADRQGVSYLCSDCGAWPGGRRDVTWKQWRAMDPGVYLLVTAKESLLNRALTALTSGQPSVQIASLRPGAGLQGLAEGARLLQRLKGHVMLYTGGLQTQCGSRPDGSHDTSCGNAPTDQGGSPGGMAGSSAGDPVNLATGEEQYQPGPDMVVYNPIGPTVVWRRLYNSLRGNAGGNYESDDFGGGWSQNYNIRVVTYNTTVTLIYANGGTHRFTADHIPDANSPHAVCTDNNVGEPVSMAWDYVQGGSVFTLTAYDRSKSIFGAADGNGGYNLTQVRDRNGNSLNFVYGYLAASGYLLLTAIQDTKFSPLLTINRRPGGNGDVTSVSDRYGRSLYYQAIPYNNVGVANGFPQISWELTVVSQIVATGTANPPHRYDYKYTYVSTYEGSELVPALSSITTPSPTGQGVSTSRILYDSSGLYVSSLIDANGNRRNFQIANNNNNQTRVTVRDPWGHIVSIYVVSFDNYMRETERFDASGNRTRQIHYPGDNTTMPPDYVADAKGRQIAYTYDNFGNLKTITNRRGVMRAFTYDFTSNPLGDLVKVQDSVQGQSKSPTTFGYDASGNLAWIKSPLPGSVGSAQVVQRSFTYDALGNILTVSVSPANDAASTITTTFNYTSDGSYSQQAAMREPLTVTDNLGHQVHLRFDARGNRIKQIDALGNETDFAYDPVSSQLLTVTYPGISGHGNANRQFTYLYRGGPLTQTTVHNEDGSIANQVRALYGAEGEILATVGPLTQVTYVYDALYRPIKLIDGAGHTTRYTYSSRGFVSSIISPGGNTVQYPLYDVNGNLLARIDAHGIRTSFLYNDPEDRLTNIQYKSANGSSLSQYNVAISYDAFGRRASRQDITGLTTYTYDDSDRGIETTTSYRDASGKYLPALSLLYDFNPDGSRRALTTPTGQFQYSYDGAGRPQSLTNPANEQTNFVYQPNGWLASWQLANKVTTQYTFNARGFVSDLATKSASGATLIDFGTMLYDGLGNRLATTVSPAGASSYGISYSYDSQSELRNETQAGQTSTFAYDAAGNPTLFRGVDPTGGQLYNADNQSNALTYDASGNPTFDNGNKLTFDPESRLTGYGNLLKAGYTSAGLRAWKEAGGVRTYFLYDGLTPVCELDSTGAVTAFNTFGPTGLISRHAGSSSIFYTFDPQNNVALRLDAKGNVKSTSHYDAFGASPGNSGGSNDPYGYGGQWGYYQDRESGQLLLGHRYYSPATGRFLTRDPIGFAGRDTNLYRYAANSPVRLSDPSGFTPSIASASGIVSIDIALYNLDAQPNRNAAGGRDWNADETQQILNVAFNDATSSSVLSPFWIFTHSFGDFDFGKQHATENDTFCVGGKRLPAYAFGNYIAGYEGAAYDANYPLSPVPALFLVNGAGVGLHFIEAAFWNIFGIDVGLSQERNDWWDETGRPDIAHGASDVQNSYWNDAIFPVLF